MLSDEALASLVRAQLGDHVRVTHHDRAVRSPMNVVLAEAEEVLGRRAAVMWLDGAAPEFFSLPGLDPAMVAFSARYLELVGSLRGILFNSALDQSVLEESAYRTHLRVTAELVLGRGDPALACYLMARSLESETLHLTGVTLADLERAPKDEAYATVWFYALTHELGHVHSADRGPQTADANAVRQITDLTENLIDALDYRRFWENYKQDAEAPIASSLEVDRLLVEMDCDLFAFQVLHRATREIMRHDGTLPDFRLTQLATEFLGVFLVINYVDNYAVLARTANWTPGSPPPDAWIKVAHLVRANMLVDFMAWYMVTWNADPDAPDPTTPSRQAALRDWLLEFVAQQAKRLDPFDRGDRSAAEEALYPRRQEPGGAERLAAQMEQGLLPQQLAVVVDFCRRAEQAGIRHPDLDLLDGMAAAPRRALAMCAAARRTVSVPFCWRTDVASPLVLRWRDRPLVLAFTTAEAAVRFIASVDVQRVEGATRVGLGRWDCVLEQDIRTRIHSGLPGDNRPDLVVAVEGRDPFPAALQSWEY